MKTGGYDDRGFSTLLFVTYISIGETVAVPLALSFDGKCDTVCSTTNEKISFRCFGALDKFRNIVDA